jgi:hypothetical protein
MVEEEPLNVSAFQNPWSTMLIITRNENSQASQEFPPFLLDQHAFEVLAI